MLRLQAGRLCPLTRPFGRLALVTVLLVLVASSSAHADSNAKTIVSGDPSTPVRVDYLGPHAPPESQTATVISRHPSWGEIEGAQWIGNGQQQSLQGDYEYVVFVPLPAGASAARLWVTWSADDCTNLRVNGTTSGPIPTGAASEGECRGGGASKLTFTKQIEGEEFVMRFGVHNHAGGGDSGPTGLIFSAIVTYDVPRPRSVRLRSGSSRTPVTVDYTGPAGPAFKDEQATPISSHASWGTIEGAKWIGYKQELAHQGDYTYTVPLPLPVGATDGRVDVTWSADDCTNVSINDEPPGPIPTGASSEGECTGGGTNKLRVIRDLRDGETALRFGVHNHAGGGAFGSTGLIFSITLTYQPSRPKRFELFSGQARTIVSYRGPAGAVDRRAATAIPRLPGGKEPLGGTSWIGLDRANGNQGDYTYDVPVNLPEGAVNAQVMVIWYADDCSNLTINGTRTWPIPTGAESQGNCIGGSDTPLSVRRNLAHGGDHTLRFDVHNHAGGGPSGPTGLYFAAFVTYDTPAIAVQGQEPRRGGPRGSSCAILNEALSCWGTGGAGSPPAGRYTQVAMSPSRSCAVNVNTQIYCWARPAPKEVQGPGFQQVSVSQSQVCGLREDRTVSCWRDSTFPYPAPSGLLNQVAVGVNHACAIRAGFSVVCWGNSFETEMYCRPASDDSGLSFFNSDFVTVVERCTRDPGTGSTTPPSGQFFQVATGTHYSCGLRLDSRMECWGRLPIGMPRTPPGRFTEVAAGDFNVCAIKEETFSVACWGQTGNGIPLPSGDVRFVRVSAAGDRHFCGITVGGLVRCWGSNSTGQLGAFAIGEDVDPVLTADRSPSSSIALRVCKRTPKRQLCVNGSVTGVKWKRSDRATVRLMRGRTVFATGAITTDELQLHPRRLVRKGRYTLVITYAKRARKAPAGRVARKAVRIS